MSALGKQFEEKVYKIPIRFFQDHHNRSDNDELGKRIVKRTKTHVHVSLTPDMASELHSDASYYADTEHGFMGSVPQGEGHHYKGIVASAKATLKAFE